MLELWSCTRQGVSRGSLHELPLIPIKWVAFPAFAACEYLWRRSWMRMTRCHPSWRKAYGKQGMMRHMCAIYGMQTAEEEREKALNSPTFPFEPSERLLERIREERATREKAKRPTAKGENHMLVHQRQWKSNRGSEDKWKESQ